jgi:hypothetical protein
MATLGERFRPDIEVDTKTRLTIEREAMIFLAGPEAEALNTGRRNNLGASHDLRCAISLVEYAVGDEEELAAYLEWLRCRTVNQLREPMFWARVECLAEHLVERRQVTSHEARALVLPTLGSHEAEALSARARALAPALGDSA